MAPSPPPLPRTPNSPTSNITTLNSFSFQLIHPIRDQGGCGSCWAFSASEVLSDRLAIATQGKTNVVLSPMALVACDTEHDMGCNGGWPECVAGLAHASLAVVL